MTDFAILVVAGVNTALIDENQALDVIMRRAEVRGIPLVVASVNLDHVHHFGARGAWAGALGRSIEWLNLIDGAPVAAVARRITGVGWPRLAGSDLIGPILDRAEAQGLRVGFLGGSEETLELLRSVLARERPDLIVAGLWSPSRAEITDPPASKELAARVRASDVDILVVGLGKPRQELWIDTYAQETGARVLLAFGAVVDFLAGRVARAPRWVVEAGMEWAWRLALEPRRLARRYLVQGPKALLEVRKAVLAEPETAFDGGANNGPMGDPGQGRGRVIDGTFVTGQDPARVTAVIVTYNSADDVDPLISSLRAQTTDVALRVVVADNDSEDSTLERLSAHVDVTVVPTGGNLGYSGGINTALRLVPPGEHVLVINPDLTLRPGAVGAMLDRLGRSGAGLVAPRILGPDGDLFPSIRREPSLLRALGDATLGSRFQGRHSSLSDIDGDSSHYCYAHPVEWASGAALLIHAEAAASLGRWDERFFLYAEEIDYQRRGRADGFATWFEPAAVVEHRQGGSGVSPELLALMAVNRIRYVEKYHGPVYSAAYQTAVQLHELLRSADPRHRTALRVVGDRSSWDVLPHATRRAGEGVEGAIIIPAHNEEAVIARTLASLADLPSSHQFEVIVVCNGTTDGTASVARRFPGVQVVEIPVASKVAALNHGDGLASKWPRLYLDADIEITPAAVRGVLSVLSDPMGRLEAARPSADYDTRGASFLVRRYYRARSRITSFEDALWGAGAYAVSEAGHRRFSEFPELAGDDLFVDRLFPAGTRAVIGTESVIVRTPRDLANLSRILRRGVRANTEHPEGATTRETASALLRTVRGPSSLLDAVVYASVAASARWRVRLERDRTAGWERDVSSR